MTVTSGDLEKSGAHRVGDRLYIEPSPSRNGVVWLWVQQHGDFQPVSLLPDEAEALREALA